MYNIAICDDNEESLYKLREYIWNNTEYNPDIMSVYLFCSGEQFLAEGSTSFQLVILDMQMGELDGYQTAKQIRGQGDTTVLAFCSGVVMPMPEHFDVQPYRYFMKQSKDEKISAVMSELLLEMIRRNVSRIEITSDGKALRVSADKILYMERKKRGSLVYVEEGLPDGTSHYTSVISSESLEEWYKQMMDEGFEYVHKSFLVNMKQIVAVVKESVVFANGVEIRITKTCKSKFMERFSFYFSKKFRRNGR